MTKTIEERAKEYEENYPNMDDSYYSYYVKDGYIEGATDQRRIDIEKAWKVFEKYATYIHPRKGEETCIMTKYKFIEAMKEEQ